MIRSTSLTELISGNGVNVSYIIRPMNVLHILPALDLYSGNYNAFHYLYHSKNIKDTHVSRVESYIF